MATNTEILRDALGLLGVLNEMETVSAEQGALGLRVLNEMMEEWRADGVNVGQWPQSDLTATSPLSQAVLPAVKYQLAAALGPHFGLRLGPDDVARGERYYSRLVRDAQVQLLTSADMSHLAWGESDGSDWNIETDS